MRKLHFVLLLFGWLFPFMLFAADNQPTNQSSDSVRKLALPGTVALTFDDGPSPIYTPQILAILKKYNIKATFFVVGTNAKKYPDLIKEIYAEGHVVSVHTMTHPMLTKIPEAQLQVEIAEPKKIVDGILGVNPKCLRYPYGASNQHVRDEIKSYGMMPVPMGFNSFDYERPGTDKIISWVLKNVYSKQVILMHDGYDHREQTVAALPAIIEGIQKKKLGFSTICG